MIDTARQKRGEIDDYFKRDFLKYSDDELIGLLGNTDSQLRTVSATLLGERKSQDAINPLCKGLIKEKALYSKIAISEALGNIGVPALSELMKYIGKIGKNQHKELPEEIFKKWNYPLPRDIVIRTIVKIGKPALPILLVVLKEANSQLAAELIDAIGHISFYSSDQNSLKKLMEIYFKYELNNVVIWKILRAMQSFSQRESVELLQKYLLNSPIPELRWEAARSLGQLKAVKILMLGSNDSDPLVRKMVEMGLDHIRNPKRIKSNF